MHFVAIARAIDELASLLAGEPLDPPEDDPAPTSPLPPEQLKLMEQIVAVLQDTIAKTDTDLLPLDLTNDALEDLEALDQLLEQAFRARAVERLKLLKVILELTQEISGALITASAEDSP
jgi:hypothetical protein